MSSTANRFEVALALREIGPLLQVLGGNRFRARAYLRGADALERLESDLARFIEEKRLTEIPGIGRALAAEIATTGESRFLTSLRSRLPPGTLDLRRVPGLTVRRIEALHDALGIANIGDLRAACEAERVRTVRRCSTSPPLPAPPSRSMATPAASTSTPDRSARRGTERFRSSSRRMPTPSVGSGTRATAWSWPGGAGFDEARS